MAIVELYKGFHIVKNSGDQMWGIYDCGKIIAQTRTLLGARIKVKRLIGEWWW